MDFKYSVSFFFSIPETMGKSSDSEEDRKERDKFAERLKKRDREKTKNVATSSGLYNFSLISD